MTKLSLSKCALPFLAFATAGALYTVTPLTAQQGAPIPSEAVLTGSLNDAPRPHAEAVRATGSIQIDGSLDEATWDDAFVIDRFIQLRPFPGALVSEHTEVRILYDDENLYVGAELYDSNPSAIVRSPLQRDNTTAQGATFAISLDTFLDKRNGAVFFFNAGGVIRDVQTAEDGRVRNIAWNSAANVKTRVHDRGWTLELLIPWTSLRFDGSREEQIWGMHLFRRIRRKNEEAMWAPVDRGWTTYNVSRAGTLGGLDGIQPGRNLSVKPYVVSSRSTGFLQLDTESDFDGGADIKYGITSGVTLGPVAEHRLLAGGGGPTAGEPDPLLAVLPRAARVLPGKPVLVPVRRPWEQRRFRAGFHAVPLPPHRPFARARAAAHPRGWPDQRYGRTPQGRSAQHAVPQRRRCRRRELHRSSGPR